MKIVDIYAASLNDEELFREMEDKVRLALSKAFYKIETCECNRNFHSPRITISAYNSAQNKLFDVEADLNPRTKGYRPMMKYLHIRLEL